MPVCFAGLSWSLVGPELVISWLWAGSESGACCLVPAHGLFKPAHNQLITSSGPALTNIKKHTWPDYTIFLFFVFQQGRQFGSLWLPLYENSTMEVNASSNCLVTNILQNIFFCI